MGSCYSMTAQQTMVFEPVLSRDLSADRMPSIGKEPSIRRRHFIIDRTGMISDTYALEEDKLGEGSYGSVSRATHKATDMVRAIKTIPKERLRSTDRVKREIAIMKLIRRLPDHQAARDVRGRRQHLPVHGAVHGRRALRPHRAG
ncbi:unnamed protein product, partial [Prorocentrum cordatum]